MWPVIAMLAASAAKSYGDNKNAAEMRKVEAAKTRYSPWTGMQGQTVANPDTMGTMMQGAATGLAMQQGLQNQKAQEGLTSAATDYYKANTPSATSTNTAAQAPMHTGTPMASAPGYQPQMGGTWNYLSQNRGPYGY